MNRIIYRKATIAMLTTGLFVAHAQAATKKDISEYGKFRAIAYEAMENCADLEINEAFFSRWSI